MNNLELKQTENYLLLIDKEAEIKKNDYKVMIDKKSLFYEQFEKHLGTYCCNEQWGKIIGHYPLNDTAKELDLPLLPNPFKNNNEIGGNGFNEKLWEDYRKPLNRSISHLEREAFIAGYKVQTKQFNLEDIENAITQSYFAMKITIHDKYNNSENGLENLKQDIISSLSTKQLPKEFIPEYEYYYHSSKEFYIDAKFVKCSKEQYELIKEEIPSCPIKVELKTIINSESKQELVGTYKY